MLQLTVMVMHILCCTVTGLNVKAMKSVFHLALRPGASRVATLKMLQKKVGVTYVDKALKFRVRE